MLDCDLLLSPNICMILLYSRQLSGVYTTRQLEYPSWFGSPNSVNEHLFIAMVSYGLHICSSDIHSPCHHKGHAIYSWQRGSMWGSRDQIQAEDWNYSIFHTFHLSSCSYDILEEALETTNIGCSITPGIIKLVGYKSELILTICSY